MKHILLTATCLVALARPAWTATLRVPEDFDRIQRAVHAAESGDTILIGPGVYEENVSVRDSLILRGAGVGKTKIVAPNREAPVIRVDVGGPVTISDLTVSHAPPPPPGATQPNTFPYAIESAFAPVTLRNLAVENPAAYALVCRYNRITLDNVSIVPLSNDPVLFEGTLAGSTAKGLTIGALEYGNQVTVIMGSIGFEKLISNLAPETEIVVSGASSDVKFLDLPKADLDKVKWLAGASPKGANPSALTEDEKQTIADNASLARDLEEQRKLARAAEPQRRKLARELQTALRASPSQAQALGALKAYLEKLYATVESEDNSDPTLDGIVAVELRSFYAKFGASALPALAELPSPYPNSTIGTYPDLFFAIDLRDALARHQAGQWLQTIAPNLREVIGSWKSTGTSDPQAAGDAFLGAVAKLSATTATADEKAKALVRETIVAEIPAFLEARGPAALDAVLRQLAISPTPLPITVSDVDLALTPQQKGALVRHWMAATP